MSLYRINVLNFSIRRYRIEFVNVNIRIEIFRKYDVKQND